MPSSSSAPPSLGIQRKNSTQKRSNFQGADHLVVMPGPNLSHLHEETRVREYAERHYSVHRSNGGENTSITEKLVFTDGSSRDSVSFVHDTQNRLLWPVLFLRDDNFPPKTMSARAKDALVRVGRYESHFCTLFCAVVVASREYVIDERKWTHANFFSRKFRHFQVIVIVTYLNLPATNMGASQVMMTSHPVADGMRADNHYQITRSSLSDAELIEAFWTVMRGFRQRLFDQYAKFTEDEYELVKFGLQHGGGEFTNVVTVKIDETPSKVPRKTV